MSMTLMVQAMKAHVGNPARKLVLIKLADNANEKGECWPSYQHIADQCEMSRRSVMRHISELESQGFLTSFHRKGVNGNSSNVYKLHIASGSVAAIEPSDNLSPPSDTDSPDSDTMSPPPSDTVSPRTSHSLEPVNEPSLVSADAKTPNRFVKPDYIREIWNQYPEHRRGGTDQQLWKKWRSMRLTESDANAVLFYLAKANPVWASSPKFVPGITKFIDEQRWLGPLPESDTPRGSDPVNWDDTSWADGFNPFEEAY